MSRYRKSGGDGQASFLSSSFLFGQSPNAEQVHLDALAAAQAEHERVREAAIRVYRNNELKEARLKLEAAARQEQERLKLEAEQARLAAQVIELQKKQIPIPKPPPREPTPPPPPPPPKKVETPQPTPQPKADPPQEPQRPLQNGGPNPLSNNSATPVQEPPRPAANNFTFPTTQSNPLSSFSNNQPRPQPAPTLKQAAVPQSDQSHVFPEAQRYVEIHKRLKELRAFMADAGKKDPQLKKKIGEMRREIRKSVGQITGGKLANKIPMERIIKILREALFDFQSPPAAGQMFVVNVPSPQEDARNNGEQLPTLFIYLLNILSKSVVAQFVDEAGVNSKAAEPIGIIAVSVFAQKDLLWRGTSLIDILIAKMRVACPVLFGVRGSEKTEAGRTRLGWRKDDGGHWISDQVHFSRMTGLAAGYAAISLRDFSKSRLKNPYPPVNYWRTLASILDTPAQEASDTQYTVVKALIENFEHSFMKFYGDMAVKAIQYAVVEFPTLAVEKSVAVSALQVLGDKLKKEQGLQLRAPPQQQQRVVNNNVFGGFR